MSSKFKMANFYEAEKHLMEFDRRMNHQQTDMINRMSELRTDLRHEITSNVSKLRAEVIEREQKTIADLKKHTDNSVKKLEIRQREAMIEQANEFYQLVEMQSQNFSQKLTAQSLNLQNQIQSSHDVLRKGIQEQGRILNGRIDDLRNDTQEVISSLTKQVNAGFERQQGQIDAVTASVNDLINRENDLQKRAILHRENCEVMLNIARTNVAVKKFYDESLSEIEQKFSNLSGFEDGSQVMIARTQSLKDEIVKLQREAQKQQLLFDIVYTNSLTNAETILATMHQNRQNTYFRDENNEVITDESGKGIKVEIDFWTNNEYSKIEDRVKELRQELIQHKNSPNLTQKRVDVILNELNECEARQANLVITAAYRGLLSEKRVETSEQIINALLKSGYKLKTDENGNYLHNYLGNEEEDKEADQREGVYAILTHGKVEITVLVNPDENILKNQVIFQRNDKNSDSPEELRRTIQFVRKAIEAESEGKLDTEGSPVTIGDQRLDELADVNALKKGMSKKLRKQLSGQ